MRIPLLFLCLLLHLCGTTAACGEVRGYPQRIVSLGPANTENIFLLGAGDRLVGCTQYCRRPEAAQHKEKIGTVLQIDTEKILALRPDLIVATGLTQPEQLAQFRRLGIAVVHLHQPRSFAEICRQFEQLGALLGLADKAIEIVDEARRKVEDIRRRTAGLSPQKVFLQIGANPLFAASKTSFTADFIKLAGGINIAGSENRGEYDYEKVLFHNPDIILIAIMGRNTGIGASEKEKWLSYPSLTAAQRKRVHLVDPNLVCSPTPISFSEALLMFAALIHPAQQD